MEFRLARWIGTSTRIQHPKQIGQGCYASDRGAGSWRSTLLLKSDRRGKTIDAVHFRNAHLVEKAPGVRRDGFKIAALSLRIKSAEGQRRLPRPGYARKNNQRIARYFYIDILEIVLPRSFYRNKPRELSARRHRFSSNSEW